MQRKDCLLRPLKSTVIDYLNKSTLDSTLSSSDYFSTKNIPYAQAKRRGFAMIIAIVILIIVSTITMFTLMQTSQSVKKTADVYLYEQAELHTKSAIEYALYQIAQNGCLNSLPAFTLDDIYDVNITMRYSYVGGGACNTFASVTTPEQNGSVLMDVTINISADNTGSDPIRYFKRTIQKL